MPPPTTRRPFLFLGLFVSLAFAAPAFAAAWDALHVFGDSYSDSGAGYADINGPTAVVYLARRLEIPSFQEVGLRLNPALATLPASITLPGADVRLSRWGEFFGDVMANAASHGITNTTNTGAGRAIFDEDTTPRGDPETYYFYHAGHPSTAVHRLVGERLLAEALTAAPTVRSP